ncbi:hypothetical protein Leryth_016249 [Lithospermum erythrorhizon]|nr:hypothetical protein Leryth_016249 [Lithospermum erythrorhizon]
MSMVKDLIMVRMQINRDKAEKWEGRLCPKPRDNFFEMCEKSSRVRLPIKCDRTHFGKWQLNGIPCKHACAAIRLNGENVEDFVDEWYTVDTYKKKRNHGPQVQSTPFGHQESMEDYQYNMSQSSINNASRPD